MTEYAKGALRSAAEEGAEAGATGGGSVAACEAAAKDALSGLLRGSLGEQVSVACSLEGDEMVATGHGELPSLVPGMSRVAVITYGYALVEAAGQ